MHFKPLFQFILIVALLLSGYNANALKIKGITIEDTTKIMKGETVVTEERYKNAKGDTLARAKVVVLINAPWEKILKTLVNFPAMKEFMPRVKSCKKISGDDKQMIVHWSLSIAWTSIEYRLLTNVDKEKKMLSWKMDTTYKDHDIRDTTGFWKFHSVEGDTSKTIAEYSLTLDTGMMVPGFVQNYLTKKDLPNVANSVKKRVESNGKWKSDD